MNVNIDSEIEAERRDMFNRILHENDKKTVAYFENFQGNLTYRVFSDFTLKCSPVNADTWVKSEMRTLLDWLADGRRCVDFRRV